jgi:hypothetical protein
MKREGIKMKIFLKRNKVLLTVIIICISLLAGYFSYSFLLSESLFSKFAAIIMPKLGNPAYYQGNLLKKIKQPLTYLFQELQIITQSLQKPQEFQRRVYRFPNLDLKS